MIEIDGRKFRLEEAWVIDTEVIHPYEGQKTGFVSSFDITSGQDIELKRVWVLAEVINYPLNQKETSSAIIWQTSEDIVNDTPRRETKG